MHLIPSVVLALLLALAWRYEAAGGIIFITVSLIPFLLLNNPGWVNAMLGVPFLLTGILFFISSYSSKR